MGRQRCHSLTEKRRTTTVNGGYFEGDERLSKPLLDTGVRFPCRVRPEGKGNFVLAETLVNAVRTRDQRVLVNRLGALKSRGII
jgi:hypothetical protein